MEFNIHPNYQALFDEAPSAKKAAVLGAASVDLGGENAEQVRDRLDIDLSSITRGAQEEREMMDTSLNARTPHNDGRDAWASAVGNIETASGHRYDFKNPDPDTVTLSDIAHALSNVCRFAGHIRRFSSVAEHSVLVSRIVEARGGDLYERAAALLHDGHEAYVWDAPSPLKPLLGDVFKDLAAAADEVIAKKFLHFNDRSVLGGPQPPPSGAAAFKQPIIKAADYTALVVEARALLPVGPTDEEWEPLPVGVVWDGCLSPYEAKMLFLQRAKELGI